MSRTLLQSCVAALAVVYAADAGAQAKQPPTVRPLGAVEQKSTELMGAVSTARALPDGRVLINDVIGRRVVLFDKTLSSFTVIADTTSATGNAYASRFAGLIAYKGDSSLFIDPTSLSMLVIDGAGKIARVMSIPRPNEAGSLIPGPGGIPAFDAQGRLVYRAPPTMRRATPGAAPGAPRPTGNAMPMPEFPDSLALVRVELATRKVDTVSFLKIPKPRFTVTSDSAGRMRMSSIVHPLPLTDDWSVLADGSIAIIRGIDYHIDWVRADGSRASSTKLPFQWRHLTDSAKVAYIDSTRVAMQKIRDQANAARAAGGTPPGPLGGANPLAAEAVAREGVMVFRMREAGAAADGPRPRNEAGGGPPANFTVPPLEFVAPNELPDYAPPFTTGAARADMEGNLWIRTTNVVNGGPVYDVVDTKGDLIDRVVLPAGRVIAGFGPGGTVFMGVRESGGVRLEQARRTTTALP